MGSILIRLPDWERRLEAAIAVARDVPFRWGASDCVHFAADVVRAITGVDPLGSDRGRWRSAFAAYRLRLRGTTLAEAVDERLPRIPPQRAGRGDVVLLDQKLGGALGICLGARCAFPKPEGLVFLPRRLAVAAWRVG